jgi:hypothetical protein
MKISLFIEILDIKRAAQKALAVSQREVSQVSVVKRAAPIVVGVETPGKLLIEVGNELVVIPQGTRCFVCGCGDDNRRSKLLITPEFLGELYGREARS